MLGLRFVRSPLESIHLPERCGTAGIEAMQCASLADRGLSYYSATRPFVGRDDGNSCDHSVMTVVLDLATTRTVVGFSDACHGLSNAKQHKICLIASTNCLNSKRRHEVIRRFTLER